MNGFPDRDKAERILTEAKSLNPGLWVAHSRNVAQCAEAIAASVQGMDSSEEDWTGYI